MTWRIDEATRLLRDIEGVLDERGWVAALFGSVSRGEEGNDLDLFLIPRNERADLDDALDAICRQTGGYRDGTRAGGPGAVVAGLWARGGDIHVVALALPLHWSSRSDQPRHAPISLRGHLRPLIGEITAR